MNEICVFSKTIDIHASDEDLNQLKTCDPQQIKRINCLLFTDEMM